MFSEENTIRDVFTSGTKQQGNMAELNFNLFKIVTRRVYSVSREPPTGHRG